MAIASISLCACQANRDSSRIVVASAGKIISLDPAQANTFHALQIISALGDTLYEIDENRDLKPKLAKSLPEIKDNGLTINIPLRENVLFHDGTDFNAEAMVFSLKRFISIGTLNYILGDRVASIHAPKEYLLQIKLNRPSSSLISLLTSVNLTPVSPTSYSDHKKKFLNRTFIGTGPYKISSFNTNHQRLEPYSLYWGSPPKNEGIDFINLSNSTALFGAMRSREIDILLSNSLDEDQHKYLHRLAKIGRLREGEGSSMEIGYITFRSNVPPLNNKFLRKGLLHSIDRELIAARVSYGLREPLRSIVPPSLKSFSSPHWPKYDPRQAKIFFQKAGYCKEEKLTLPFTFRSNVPADKLLALTWKEQLDRDFPECIQLELNGVESTTIYRQLGKGSYQSVMLDWRGAYPDPEAYLSPLLSCKKNNGEICEIGEAAISGSFWTSPLIQKKLQESDHLTGSERSNKFNQIEKKAAEGSAYLPIWLVKPRAWSQLHISTPQFNGSGQMLLQEIKVIK